MIKNHFVKNWNLVFLAATLVVHLSASLAIHAQTATPRVEPWLSAKMAARLQAATTSDNPVLLRIDYDAGHGIGNSRKQVNEEFADMLAFIFEQLGGGVSEK